MNGGGIIEGLSPLVFFLLYLLLMLKLLQRMNSKLEIHVEDFNPVIKLLVQKQLKN